MGGRGSSSPGRAGLSAPAADTLPYTVTGYEDDLGGAVYPFLEATGRAWHVLTRPVGEDVAYHPAHTFAPAGDARPTLRWVNGDRVSDLYVDGMDTEQFLVATGLRLDLQEGAFVLSKRLSRLMRPHFVSGFFAPEDVRVAYMEQTPDEAKVWDGAGLVSRRMLETFVLSADLSPAKREKLRHEMAHAGRVEFTVMTPAGQDKGHAIVVEDDVGLTDEEGNPVDFLLPRDTKRAVRLENGATFVGLSFVHGRDRMRLDVQSLINLHPFFTAEQLLGWLEDEGELFARAVADGTAGEAMARVDADGRITHATLEEVQRWPLREYLVSGGHPAWFRTHARTLMNQHLKRLNHSTLEKMRLPIPGGRHYVMPAAAGRRAGVPGLAGDEAVPRGHIKIDPRYGTAWVNDADWLALADSPDGSGIAAILGGADHDDALWLYPFTDHDGARKVLAWRSPNQAGEYVVLTPTPDSAIPAWTDAGGDITAFPAGDSRALPSRIDHTETTYLGLVETEAAGGPGAGGPAGKAYTVAAMDAAVERALANRGALGMYCNSLMVNKALFGRLPEAPPAPLEAIIDAAVKTGADLSEVVAWNVENTREILEAGVPVPALLHHRLSVDYGDRENRPPPPRPSDGHWLDRLEAGVKEHIDAMIARRDELAAQAMPPAGLFDSVAADAEALALGAGLNQAFAAALNRRPASGRDMPDGAGQTTPLGRARRAAEAYLAHFPPDRRRAILRGALASTYLGEGTPSDAAAWLAAGEEPDEAARPGLGGAIATETVAALREIGLLDEVMEREGGLLVYPNAAPALPTVRTVGIRGVWFHRVRAERARQGRPVPETMNDVPRPEQRRAKQQVAEMAKTAWRDLELHIREEAQPAGAGTRKVAYTADGRRVGTVSRESEGRVAAGDVLRLRFGVARDRGFCKNPRQRSIQIFSINFSHRPLWKGCRLHHVINGADCKSDFNLYLWENSLD